MSKTIYFIRHAQSVMSGSVPHEDWPLSDLGQRQAKDVVPHLEQLGIEKVYSSPFVRCRETVRPFVEKAAVPIEYHDDLREQRLNYGWMEDFNSHWHKVWKDFHFCLPNCETSHQAQTRFSNVLEKIVQESTAKTIAISTHGMVIGLFLNKLNSQFSRQQTEKLRNLEILKFRYLDQKIVWDERFFLRELELLATPHHESPVFK